MSYALLTEGNQKTAKSTKLGYLTAILHLAPFTMAGTGKNVCPWSTPGCRAGCLNTAGRGRFANIQEARTRRTKLFYENNNLFYTTLHKEIRAFERRAKRLGMLPAVRLDGTSDLGIALNVAEHHPDVQFYDYTKSRLRMRAFLNGHYPKNVHFTFSNSEENSAVSAGVALSGGNLAVVFSTKKGHELPMFWQNLPVIDGDDHDLRFLDPKGVIVGLRAKGKAKQDNTGFVVRL